MSGGANAQALVCERLEAEFIDLSAQVENAPAPAGWQQAYEEQLGHIGTVQGQMSSLNCDGVFGPPQCQQLNDSLQQMQQNLAYLDGQRQPELLVLQAANRLEQVRQALVTQNCANRQTQPTQPVAVQPPQPATGLSTTTISSSEQTFATMCVRKCDGYYFPINPNSKAADLAEDTEICQALCPGQDTELYVFRTPQETPAQMRSLNGQPYTSLANAYLFRQQNNPACSCDATGGTGTVQASTPPAGLGQDIGIGEDLQDLTPAATAEYPAIPSVDEINQTASVASSTSELTAQPQAQDGTEPVIVQKKFVPREVEPRQGPIRKVGPKFFPDQ